MGILAWVTEVVVIVVVAVVVNGKGVALIKLLRKN